MCKVVQNRTGESLESIVEMHKEANMRCQMCKLNEKSTLPDHLKLGPWIDIEQEEGV